MDYTNLLYHQIIERIQDYTRRNKLSNVYMANASGIDAGDYSRMLQGKRKYLLSAKDAKGLADLMCISVERLIWGDDTEKELFIKLVLLAALTNGSKTAPIKYYSTPEPLFRWALTQECLPKELHDYAVTALAVLEQSPAVDINITQVYQAYTDPDVNSSPTGAPLTIVSVYNEITAFFCDEYSFYYNERNAHLFSLLKNKRDTTLDALAGEIMNQILTDYSFTEKYTTRILTLFQNNAAGSFDDRKAALQNLLCGGSDFGDAIQDWGRQDYKDFIRVFEDFWRKHKKDYLAYFHGVLFADQNVVKKGLKAIPNDVLNSIFASPGAISMLHKQNAMEEFESDEILLARNYFRFSVHSALRKQKVLCNIELKKEDDFEVYSQQYVDELIEKTQAYAPIIKRQKR